MVTQRPFGDAAIKYEDLRYRVSENENPETRRILEVLYFGCHAMRTHDTREDRKYTVNIIIKVIDVIEVIFELSILTSFLS
jgi:hypothetical protein